jgi:hypothetical protein
MQKSPIWKTLVEAVNEETKGILKDARSSAKETLFVIKEGTEPLPTTLVVALPKSLSS